MKADLLQKNSRFSFLVTWLFYVSGYYNNSPVANLTCSKYLKALICEIVNVCFESQD